MGTSIDLDLSTVVVFKGNRIQRSQKKVLYSGNLKDPFPLLSNLIPNDQMNSVHNFVLLSV